MTEVGISKLTPEHFPGAGGRERAFGYRQRCDSNLIRRPGLVTEFMFWERAVGDRTLAPYR
jgi:hypothetical protein